MASKVLYFCPPPPGNPEADITASLMLMLMLGVGGTFGTHVTLYISCASSTVQKTK